MKEVFLEKNQSYMLRIVEELYKTPNKEISYIKLSEKLNIDRRAVNRLITELINYDKQQEKPHFSYNKHILKERYPNPPHPSELLHIMIEDSVKYKIIKSLFLNEDSNGTDLSYDLCVSRSVFQKHVAGLRKLMKDYELNLSFHSKETIKGRELQVRYFYNALFWELSLCDSYLNLPVIQNVTKMLLRINPDIDYFSMQRFNLSVFILLKRTQNKHFIRLREEFFIENHPLISYDDFYREVKEAGVLKYCTEPGTEQVECENLYLLFCTISPIPLDYEKNNVDIVYHTDDIADSFVELLGREFDFTLQKNEINYIKINLYYFNKLANLYKGPSPIFGVQNFDEKLKLLLPKDYRIIHETLNIFVARFPEAAKMIERFPIVRNIYGLLLTTIFKEHKPKLRILLQSKASPLQREQMIWVIKSVSLFPIDVLSISQLGGELPDAVISDWIPPDICKSTPFFNLSSVSNISNFTTLEAFICKQLDGVFIN
ncbi:MAG: helix-turn-helix domain-containing protein [Lachnospiraceae bacterium]|jgi:hypothetical protein|nr:helix-turn-helix domain-containing protein [Lachnospiraceae bacterium]